MGYPVCAATFIFGWVTFQFFSPDCHLLVQTRGLHATCAHASRLGYNTVAPTVRHEGLTNLYTLPFTSLAPVSFFLFRPSLQNDTY